MNATTLVGAAAQLVVLAVVGSSAAALFWGRHVMGGRGPRTGDMGPPERALLAITGGVGFAALLMVAHIATGGAVFGLPGVVPAAATALVWRARHRLVLPRPGRPGPGWAVAAVLGAIYILPVLVAGSSLKTGDGPWHRGWTEQLLAGDPVPTGPAPVFGANAYPWGWHALLATMVRLVPHTTVATAGESLHVLVVAAIPLAGAVLARRVRPDAGWWGAAAAGLIGGFGWVAARAPVFFTSPSEAGLGADLVVASPNAVYELLPPALPRELGLVLLAGAGLLLLGMAAGGRRAGLRAGVATGLVGLVSVPLFVSGCLWALAAVALARRQRARLLGAVGAGAGATFALWAGPALADYVRYGGFVGVTPELGKEWPLASALGSWGLLLPLAMAGAVAVAVSRGSGGQGGVVLSWLGATAALLGVARIRSLMDWDLAGNATLLHQGRVWPVAHLLGASLAGSALALGHEWVAARSRLAGAAAAVAIIGCGLASPWCASAGLERLMRIHEAGYIYARADVAPGSFVRRAAARLGPDDLVEVRESRAMALLLWEFSGAKLTLYDDPRVAGNDLRIRYRKLARAWDARMAAGGFEAGYVVAPGGSGTEATRARPLGEEDRSASGEILEEGVFRERRWTLIRLPEPSGPEP